MPVIEHKATRGLARAVGLVAAIWVVVALGIVACFGAVVVAFELFGTAGLLTLIAAGGFVACVAVVWAFDAS